jgi:ferredoxin-fold anticodon binding domain-containing protein
MIKKELVQIENISVDELTEIIAEKLVDKLEKRIATLISKQNDEELLTRTETVELLKINLTTLWNWTKKGKITAYGIGNRVYYKRGEIMKALVEFKH